MLRLWLSQDVPKKQLSPEEAKAKALELQAKAKAKREAMDRASTIESEKLRVRMGKEMAAAVRIEEDQKMQRIADERRRAKEADAKAKDKIRAILEEDKCVLCPWACCSRHAAEILELLDIAPGSMLPVRFPSKLSCILNTLW
jgi:hypothetical protein